MKHDFDEKRRKVHQVANNNNKAFLDETAFSTLLPKLDESVLKIDAVLLGFNGFLDKYHKSLGYSILDLLNAFNISLSDYAVKLESGKLLAVFKRLFFQKICKREKIASINTLHQALSLFESKKNIIVLSGAGVSVSCGIPDFRSNNGVYSRLDEFDLDDPQLMFDLEYFKFKPETFYSFAREIYPSNFTPSLSHRFIKLLESKGKLLRNYTQNIDTLEQAAGITKVLQCHGSFATASCVSCHFKVKGDYIKNDIMARRVPKCPRCEKRIRRKEEVEDKLSVLKPDIVFFGEMLGNDFAALFEKDRKVIFVRLAIFKLHYNLIRKVVDLLVVIGSSLEVAPVANIRDRIPHDIPQILINVEERPGMADFDVKLLGFADVIVRELCDRLNWKLDEE
ncbi:NAD-dependent protein deacetylase sirtuin-1, partial [Nowakowskiella sp. JEL0078]